MSHALGGPLGFIYVLTFLVTFAVASMEGAFTPYIRHFYLASKDPDSISMRISGYCFAYIGVVLILIQGGAIRPLRKRFSERQLILTGIALMALGFWIFALPHSIALLLAGPLLAISAGTAINTPSLRALVSRLSAADVQGASLGMAASFDSLARGIGPGFGGWLAGHNGLASPFYVSGAIMSVALLWAIAQSSKLTSEPK
jgi:predicted MFS family arabinose efflux permease